MYISINCFKSMLQVIISNHQVIISKSFLTHLFSIYPISQRQQPFSSLSSQIFLVLECHRKKIMQCVLFCFQVLSFSIILFQLLVICLLSSLNSIPFYKYTILFFIHSFVHGQLDSFLVLAFANSASMNIWVHVSFKLVFIFSR